MKAPCLACDHHLAGRSKESDRCTYCQARIDYARHISGCDGMQTITKEPSPMTQDTIAPPPHETKQCADPECSHGKTAQPIDNFRIHPPSGKRMRICKDCQARRIAAGHRKKSRAAKKAAQPDSSAPAFATMSGDTIFIDGPADIIARLKTLAQREFRTPEQQLRWIIQTYVSPSTTERSL